MNRAQIRTSLGPGYAMKSDREIDRIVVAVLKGVREPSEAMADAGLKAAPFDKVYDGEPYKRGDTGEVVWRAMIDALIAQVREG